MPPKCKFTRQQMVEAAVELTRRQGAAALTARALAQALECSVKPIFGLFQNMEQLHAAVLEQANALYQQYLQADMAAGVYPPYKASGMAYIRFAKEEPELFKLLFMRDRRGEVIPDNLEDIRPLLALLQKNLGLSQETATLFHLELWLYVHGIATMAATGYLDWELDFISNALTDAYQGLKHRHCKGDSICTP